MAVYGRFRERWDPTKSKTKVSKNRTYELGGTLSTGQLLLWLNAESKDTDFIYGVVSADEVLDIHGDNKDLCGLESVRAAHFQPNALTFMKDGTDRAYVEGFNLGFSTAKLAGAEYDAGAQTREHDTFISFWVKVSQHNFGTSGGHHLGGFYRSLVADSGSTPTTDLEPAILFGIGSSGQPEMTIFTTGALSDRIFWSGPTNGKTIPEDTWTHVCFVIKKPFYYAVTPPDEWYEYQEMVDLYIDGQKVTATPSGTVIANENIDEAAMFDDVDLDLLLGNQTKGFSDNNVQGTPTEGFFGSIGEFTVFTQATGNSESVAKFVYEAQREGVFHLHSGIHNSSPRLEQLDLDRDSLYPYNFTLENYTMGAYQTPVERTSSRSQSRYTEGYKVGETWQENASQYFQNENTNVLPHLRLHYSDTLLTNGDWYSDARSEFFSEDLSPAPDGFVVDDQASDELYREHVSQSQVTPFVEFGVEEQYKDCFVIEIPIPNATQLELGTDRGTEGVRITGTSVNGSVSGDVANMAYYNFQSGEWQATTTPKDGDPSYTLGMATPADTDFIDQNAIGFSPLTGIIVPASERLAEKVVPMHGLPTSDFGFPTSSGYSPNPGQTIDLSKYIDKPVILEGWEIKTKVIPKVGYQDESGTFYSVGAGRSPFHYGAHGEAAVLYNYRTQVSAFDTNIVVDGADSYHMGTTIPTTVEGPGGETQPPKDQPGLVTSGITAFLMKKPKIVDEVALGDSIRDTFQNDKEITKFTNLDDGTGSWFPTDDLQPQQINTTTYANHYGGGAAPVVSTADSTTNSSNLQLLGWLQHIYHNDELLNDYSSRQHWVREGDTSNQYFFRDGANIIDLLGKENATYVNGLLYDNTDTYDLSLVGNTKQVGKIPRGIPISNFFIEGSFRPIRINTSTQAPHYAASTQSETTFNVGDGTLANHDVVPRYGAPSRTRLSTKLPKVNLPSTKDTGNIGVLQQEVQLFNSIEDDSTVILNPTDELVLGIQNSISTAFASQQIDGANFIRWGRTSLTIPSQTPTEGTSYLRLFVKKTRRDEDFNIVADSSDYNANVNRDLGDVANGDQWKTSNLSIYSGSMADDIVGPTYFEPPEVRISLPAIWESVASGKVLQDKTEFTKKFANWFGDTMNLVDSSGPFRLDRPYWHAIFQFMYDVEFQRVGGTDPTLVSFEFNSNTRNWNYLINNTNAQWLERILNGFNPQDGVTELRNDFTDYDGDGNTDDAMKTLPCEPYPIKTTWSEGGGGAGIQTSSGIDDWLPSKLDALKVDWSSLANKIFEDRRLPSYDLTDGFYDLQVLVDSLVGFVTRRGQYTQGASTMAPEDVYIWNDHTFFQAKLKDSLGNWKYSESGLGPVDPRLEGCWLIEELNPNPNPPVPMDEDGTTPLLTAGRTRGYKDCKAISALYTKLQLPFYNNSALEGVIESMLVEFRPIQIDSTPEGRPRYTPKPGQTIGDTLQLGDSFIFTDDHRIVKLEPAGADVNSEDQKWKNNQVVFTVVSEGVPSRVKLADPVSPGLNYQDGTPTGFRPITWNNQDTGPDSVEYTWTDAQGENPETLWLTPLFRYYIDPIPSFNYNFYQWWNAIKNAVNNQGEHNTALLVEATSDMGSGTALIFRNEPKLATIFKANESEINSSMGMYLCGVDLSGTPSDPSLDFPLNMLGATANELHIDYDKTQVFNYREFSNQYTNSLEDPIGVDPDADDGSNIWYQKGGRLFDINGDEIAVPTPSNTNVGVYASRIIGLYSAEAYFDPLNEYDDTNPIHSDPGKISITYNSLSPTGPTFSAKEATYTEEINRTIDRKVLFRNSEKVNTIEDITINPQLIGKASSYGGLKRMSTLVDSRTYWDSLMPLSDVPNTLNLWEFTGEKYSTDGKGMGWLLEENPKKDGTQYETSSIRLLFDGSNPSLYDISNSSTIEYTYLANGITYQFPPVVTVDNVQIDTLGVTNYFQRDFRGQRDMSKYTIRNLLFGFGDNPQGRHTIRPSASIWDAYAPDTKVVTQDWADELLLDPPRGIRFGLLNYDEKPKYAFSNTSFGQLRDMYEQAYDTKMSNFESDPKLFGSAVVVNPINPTNPEIPKLMENTSRYNKTTDATIVKPYIEDNYESTPNPVNLKSETLRVDVAGSIRSKAVLAPGNVASNIRRR